MAHVASTADGVRSSTNAQTALPRAAREHYSRVIYVTTTMVLDALFVTAAFPIAYWLYFHTGTVNPLKGIPPFSMYYRPIPLIVVLWFVIARSFDLHRYPKGFSWASNVVKVFQAIGTSCLITMAMTFMYRGFSYSRATLLLGWMVAGGLMSVQRLLAWEILSILRTFGLARTRTAIVGLARPARDIVRNMQTFVEMGYHVVGFVPDHLEDENALVGKDVPCLGSAADIKDIVRRYGIELLVIAIPHTEQRRILEIISAVDLEKVEVRLTSDVLDIMTRPVGIDEVAGIPLLGLRGHPLNTWRGWVKRGIDLAGSLVGLAVLSPVLLAIAALVKVTSKGPVFFKQTRVGFDDRPFVMYKFRTMRVDAEAHTGPVFAQKGDPRYTPIGGLLRRTSLDEFPQLINVLKGEMSLVGPRPERPEFVERFRKEVPEYIHRHKVKCGITGWAQVNGLRGRTSIEERIEHDRYYITNWSLGLDFVVLIKTIREVLRGENAY